MQTKSLINQFNSIKNGVSPSKLDDVEIPAKPKLVSAYDLYNSDTKEIPSLLHPILPKVGLACLAGASDTGKSTFLRQLALDVALKQGDFLGFEIQSTNHKVLYLSTEDSQDAMEVLIKRSLNDQSPDLENLNNLDFIFEWEDVIKDIDNYLLEGNHELVIIDAFSDIFEGQMNDINSTRKFLTKFSQLAQKYKCLFLFLHHTGKNREDSPPNKNNLIGSQGFEAKMRVVFELRKDFFDTGKRHLCIVKGNYLSSEYKDESFILEFDGYRFENTDERMDFMQLGKPDKDEYNANRAANDDLIQKITELREKGSSQRNIAEKLGISQGKVQRIIKAHKLQKSAPTQEVPIELNRFDTSTQEIPIDSNRLDASVQQDSETPSKPLDDLKNILNEIWINDEMYKFQITNAISKKYRFDEKQANMIFDQIKAQGLIEEEKELLYTRK